MTVDDLRPGPRMSGERLIYMPLGGAGEIGMNAYVYGYGPPDRERLWSWTWA
jgi:hypothetical protein